MDRADLLAALKSRADVLTIPELPRNRLRLIQRIASGAFGTVYTAEADNVPEYNAAPATQRRLVAAKYLPNATDKDRCGFHSNYFQIKPSPPGGTWMVKRKIKFIFSFW